MEEGVVRDGAEKSYWCSRVGSRHGMVGEREVLGYLSLKRLRLGVNGVVSVKYWVRVMRLEISSL